MSDFQIGKNELKKYKGPGGDVVIPDGIKQIGMNAFMYCKSLTGVTIPDSVTAIQSFAFAECVNLTNVTIPDSIKSISRGAFIGCTALREVFLPENIEFIVFGKDNCFSYPTHIHIQDIKKLPAGDRFLAVLGLAEERILMHLPIA